MMAEVTGNWTCAVCAKSGLRLNHGPRETRYMRERDPNVYCKVHRPVGAESVD